MTFLHSVFCIVQRRTMANGCFENKRTTLRRDATIIFFSSGCIAHAPTYTRPRITVYISVRSWRGDARSYFTLWVKKRRLGGHQTFAYIGLFDDRWRIYIFVNKFLRRLRKQSFDDSANTQMHIARAHVCGFRYIIRIFKNKYHEYLHK